ncbi:methyltransferase FkbM family [Denitrovibrio acetiphilus DSM 12809]|uniref:Methyltransferase FkbM family n=1 Tax=Denitrovibrio acetiphilus (strain DSM 12809 / NBRC 114555 / N2460) TaxID=522772 RepID=D4H586_DENA2|nr:FkbM family methyltransferase [Denitrovibrio acetiphilus]ADD69442.1 methyltransferase FkbM family [Denitrovibrio acetiphilus DSM 12809]
MIIDVGANHGDFAIDAAERNPQEIVIAIEPIPELCDKISALIKNKNLQNVKIVRCAIDVEKRIDTLNVAKHADWGVSSLLEFNHDNISKDEYWKTRNDMYFDEKIEVEVKRMDDVLDELGINERINFIKIDVQGFDLNVLKSLGNKAELVDAGMIEVSIVKEEQLYVTDLADTVMDAFFWLSENNFEVYALKPNDPASKELNLFFRKKGIDHKEIEDRYNLKGIHMYDGKHYWHYPSDKLEFVEEKFVNTDNQLAKANNRIAAYQNLIKNLNQAILGTAEEQNDPDNYNLLHNTIRLAEDYKNVVARCESQERELQTLKKNLGVKLFIKMSEKLRRK